MDRLKLINEIRKRPPLWDLQSSEHKTRTCVPEMWSDVAINMGFNVTADDCKRKWKNLRDAYHAEVKRIEIRIARDIMKGVYDPNYEYNSKWTYYEHMSFIKDIKKPRRNIIFQKFKSHNQNSHKVNEDSNNYCNPLHYMELNSETKLNADENYTLNDNDINDLYDEQLLEDDQMLQKTALPQPLIPTVNKRKTENTVSSNCKCSKISNQQLNFLEAEDVEKEDHISMNSLSLDVSYASNMAFKNDSDYNFLVSFLQQMKKMSELQNLQFRAKMSGLMYSIMSASATSVTSSVTDSYNT